MKAMFTVGEIARLHKLPKQTLIFYDKEGVFKPNIIDKSNGYRYYTADQLEVLDSVLMLRDIGFSLKQIKSFLEKRGPQEVERLLTKQKDAVSEQAARLTEIARKLKRKIQTLQELDKPHQDKIITTKKAEYFATEQILAPNNLLQTDIATKKLLTRAYSEGYPFYYQVGVIVPISRLLAGEFEAAEFACLPLINKVTADNVIQKPAGIYAQGFHRGEYSQIGQAYLRLLQLIKVSNYAPKQYAFEYCIADSLTSKSAADYITEIQIPLELSK